jgi:hypothetical protein
MEPLLDKRTNKPKSPELTKVKENEISARSEYSSQKSLGHLAQDTGFQKTPAQIITKLMKLKPYNTCWLTK